MAKFYEKLCSLTPSLIPGLLSEDECQFMINWFNQNEFRATLAKAQYEGVVLNQQARQCKIINLLDDDIKKNESPDNVRVVSISRKIIERFSDCNDANYDFKVDDITQLEIGKYEVGDYFVEHRDAPNEVGGRMRKLSLTINLNDNFEGGMLMLEDYNKIDRDRDVGDGVVFSPFLKHEVTEVTEGIRYSIFGWLEGPRFR